MCVVHDDTCECEGSIGSDIGNDTQDWRITNRAILTRVVAALIGDGRSFHDTISSNGRGLASDRFPMYFLVDAL